jgi:hypothetical protein
MEPDYKFILYLDEDDHNIIFDKTYPDEYESSAKEREARDERHPCALSHTLTSNNKYYVSR